MKKNSIITIIVVLLVVGAGYLVAFKASDNKKKTTEKNEAFIQEVASELINAEGDPVNFKDFKGKIIFINNWASWCPPCVAEMPTIQALKKSVPAEDVNFVMVSFDRNPQKGIQWMHQQGLDLSVYFPGQKFPERFLTSSIPATFILDREGKLLHQQMGMADYSADAFVKRMKKWATE